MSQVILKSGREKSVRNRHPWVFAGAIERIDGNPDDGDVVTVRSVRGVFLARGYLNRRSQITVRLLSWDETEAIDDAFWEQRIASAVRRRQALSAEPRTTAYRLVYAEADLVPGLVVDRYGDFLVLQCLTLGIARRRAQIVSVLSHMLAPQGIYERSDVDVREYEGLPPNVGVLCGDAPSPELSILENGHTFLVDVVNGQKTGFYLDLRPAREALSRYAREKEMLNAFCYSGAFSIYAAQAGAGPITNLDTSAGALTLARRNAEQNGLGDRGTDAYVEGDVFAELRRFRDQGRSFDLIVLDPPKFAPTRQHVERASRAYKDINLLAIKLLRPGGILFTLSCSGGVDSGLFQKIVFGASLDAQREVQIMELLTQGSDHPVLLSFPESAYLKGLVCRVL